MHGVGLKREIYDRCYYYISDVLLESIYLSVSDFVGIFLLGVHRVSLSPARARSRAIINKQGTNIMADLMNDICSLSHLLKRDSEEDRQTDDRSRPTEEMQ